MEKVILIAMMTVIPSLGALRNEPAPEVEKNQSKSRMSLSEARHEWPSHDLVEGNLPVARWDAKDSLHQYDGDLLACVELQPYSD